MGNLFNEDFQDFLRIIHRREVAYILVGGYSVILHGYARTTGDLDVWVRKTAANHERLTQAFKEFGMPLFDMTAENFLHNPAFDVFTFGRSPVAIDVITALKGADFEEAYAQAELREVDGLPVRVLHYQHLVQAKKAAARPRDQDDLDNLALHHE